MGWCPNQLSPWVRAVPVDFFCKHPSLDLVFYFPWASACTLLAMFVPYLLSLSCSPWWMASSLKWAPFHLLQGSSKPWVEFILLMKLSATPLHLLYPSYSTSTKCTDCVILSWFYVFITDATFFLKYPILFHQDASWLILTTQIKYHLFLKPFWLPHLVMWQPFRFYASILCLSLLNKN